MNLTKPDRNRNVLLIVIDQLRADCLRLAVDGILVLPNLNKLMQDGVTFQRHYTVANPCGPSRASLLTGLYAMNHRSVRNGAPLRADISNVALEARRSGYEPLLFGYTDTSGDPRRYHPNDPDIRSYEGPMPGFNEVVELRQGSKSYPWRAHLWRQGYELPPYDRFYAPRQFGPATGPGPRDPAFYRAEDSDTAFLTDACIGQLAVRTGQQWFALLTYVRPHQPLIAPEPFNRMYDPASMPLAERLPTPAAEAAMHPFLAADLKRDLIGSMIKGYDCRLDNESAADVSNLRAVYFGLTTEVDQHIGRIIRHLEETGQLDSTLLIITADHGEMLGDRRQWGKMSVYDAAYRVPLIIRDPERSAVNGRPVDEFTESVDLSPTILDWISGTVPAAMNGKSLLPLIDGQSPDNWRDCSYSELDFGDPDIPTIWQRATGVGQREANLAILRERRFNLVHFNGGLPPLLFDMESAGERKNLADDPAHAVELLRMTRKLLDHRMRHADHTLSDMKVTAGGTVNDRP